MPGSRMALSILGYLLIRASASTRLGSSDRLGGHEAGGQFLGRVREAVDAPVGGGCGITHDLVGWGRCGQ